MNQFKTLGLLSLLSGLLVAIGYGLGGSSGALIGLAIAAISNLVSWYQSDKIALAAYRAQPLSEMEAPDLFKMVQKISDRAEIPMPQIFVVPSPAANAFATGRDPAHAAVAVTEGIVNLLAPDELEAVIAHELSHVKTATPSPRLLRPPSLGQFHTWHKFCNTVCGSVAVPATNVRVAATP